MLISIDLKRGKIITDSSIGYSNVSKSINNTKGNMNLVIDKRKKVNMFSRLRILL